MKYLSSIMILVLIGLTSTALSQSSFLLDNRLATINQHAVDVDISHSDLIFTSNSNPGTSVTLGTAPVDSLLVTHADGGKARHIFTYDANGKISVESVDDRNGDIWTNVARYIYTYDANDNNTELLIERYGSNSRRTKSTYDIYGNEITRLIESWTGSAWKNVVQLTFDYNLSNRIDYLVAEHWTDAGGWENDYAESYFYTGDFLTRFQHNDWRDTGWENSVQLMFMINNGFTTNYTRDVWNEDESFWSSNAEAAYQYDNNGNLISEIHRTWNAFDDVFVNNRRYVYGYDDNNKRVSYHVERWNGAEAGGWGNLTQEIYSYDGVGNLILYTSNYWDGANWAASDNSICFVDEVGGQLCAGGTYREAGDYQTSQGTEIKFFYNGTSINTENESQIEGFVLAQNYPNPFNPVTNIGFSTLTSEYVKLEVYNTLGQLVSTLVNGNLPAGDYNFSFDGTELTSGIYFYKLSAGGFSETHKMTLLK